MRGCLRASRMVVKMVNIIKTEVVSDKSFMVWLVNNNIVNAG